MNDRYALMTLALASAGWLAGSQVEKQPSAAEEIMWRKLDLSHQVLDALALDDFEAMEAYASDLVALSDHGRLFVSDTDEYRGESRRFQTSASSLEAAARSRNTAAAALAYVELTLSCVRCHRMLGGGGRQ